MSRSYESAKRQHAGKRLSFELDGVTFTCSTDISVLDFSELASYADLDAYSPEGVAVLKNFFTILLGESEYRRFRRHVAAHGTDDDTIVQIIGDLAEDYLGRPTQAPSRSDSSPSVSGPGSTAPGSHKVVNLGSGRVSAAPLEIPTLADLGDVEQVS